MASHKLPWIFLDRLRCLSRNVRHYNNKCSEYFCNTLCTALFLTHGSVGSRLAKQIPLNKNHFDPSLIAALFLSFGFILDLQQVCEEVFLFTFFSLWLFLQSIASQRSVVLTLCYQLLVKMRSTVFSRENMDAHTRLMLTWERSLNFTSNEDLCQLPQCHLWRRETCSKEGYGVTCRASFQPNPAAADQQIWDGRSGLDCMLEKTSIKHKSTEWKLKCLPESCHRLGQELLCGVRMFSPCLCRFSLPAKTCMLGLSPVSTLDRSTG